MPNTSTTKKLDFFRPPIVTVLGHVDHGKTTLLDTIRKTRLVAKEYGQITQHIGAYQMTVPLEGEPSSSAIKRAITFIDTPGHQLFVKMRSCGAEVADIAILVVAANDGVMPQTIESIEHIKAANISCIVAINKIDLPDINLEKIKKQLTKNGLKLEEYGGEIPIVPISAKENRGIDKLLEMIFLLAELNQIKEDTPGKLKAVVIESILSKHRGIVATVILRSGNLSVGEMLICENQEFKARALTDWLGENLKKVNASSAIEILGWKNMPAVGSLVFKKKETELTLLAKKELTQLKQKSISNREIQTDIDQERIKFIIKADTVGTLETIVSVLKEKDNILIVGDGVGSITESDVLLAKTTDALIIGFQVKYPKQVKKLAETEKVLIKTYNIIYKLIEEIDDVVEAIKKECLEDIKGEAKVIAIFNMKEGLIAGIKVISGRITQGDKVKILREEKEIGKTRIKSLRHGKESINSAKQGVEAGVLLSQKIDFLTGDSIISIG